MPLTKRVCKHVRQRYFLAVMCMMGHMLTTMCHHSFIVLLKNMTYQERHLFVKPPCAASQDHNNDTLGSEEFLWSRETQVYLLSSYSLGFYVGMVPIGLATDRFGAKTLFGLSVFVPGICSLITPLCARNSPYLLMFNRIVFGTFEAAQFPTTQYIAARWFPARQHAIMLSAMFVGMPFGHIAGMHLLNGLGHIHQWTSLFYVVSVFCIIWAWFWQATIWDNPFEHPFITPRELDMLADKIPMFANDTELPPGWKWPWREIFSCTSLWILSLGYFGYTFFFNFALFIIPYVYLLEIQNYNISYEDVLSTFVNLMMASSIIASGFISDQVIHSRWLNTTHIVKVFYSVSTIIGSLFLLGVTHSGCSITTIVLFYVAAILCLGFGYTNWPHSCLNIAPNFVGTSMAITSVLGVIVMPFHLYVTHALTYHNTLSQWKTVSYLNAAISIFATAMFLKWGNCQLRSWNEPKTRKIREIDYESAPASNQSSLNKMDDGGDLPKSGQGSTSDALSRKTPSKMSSGYSLKNINKSRSKTGSSTSSRRRQMNFDKAEDGLEEEYGVVEVTPDLSPKQISSKLSTPKSQVGDVISEHTDLSVAPIASIIKRFVGVGSNEQENSPKKHVVFS